MSTNLMELGTTFFVGVFILIGSWLLLCVVFRLRSPFSVKTNYWISTLFAVSGLALGVVFENVSDKFVDEEDRWYSWLLRDDAELKFESVFEVTDTDLPKPENLAKELATHHLFEQTDSPQGSFAQQYVTDSRKRQYSTELDRKERLKRKEKVEENLTKAVQLVYYHARNRTLLEDTYFEELTAIQRRIDFSRTCALIAFLLIPACALLVVLRVILHTFSAFDDFVGWLGDLLPSGWIETPTANEPYWRWWSRAGLLVVVSLFIHIGAARAYAIEEDQFDKRVFGYYLSILDSTGKADVAIVYSPVSKISPFGGPYSYDAGEQKLINFGEYKHRKLYLTRQATLTKKLFLRSVQANKKSDDNGKLFQR